MKLNLFDTSDLTSTSDEEVQRTKVARDRQPTDRQITGKYLEKAQRL